MLMFLEMHNDQTRVRECANRSTRLWQTQFRTAWSPGHRIPPKKQLDAVAVNLRIRLAVIEENTTMYQVVTFPLWQFLIAAHTTPVSFHFLGLNQQADSALEWYPEPAEAKFLSHVAHDPAN